MKNTMLAILAAALAALAPSAMAAEGGSDRDDDAGVRQPTMRELENKIDQAVREIRGVLAAVGPLATATAVDALTTEVRANHTTIVGKFAQQIRATDSGRNVGSAAALRVRWDRQRKRQHFGRLRSATLPCRRKHDLRLPGGNRRHERAVYRQNPAGLQQPYGDNAICQRELSRRFLRGGGNGKRRNNVCPRVRLHPFSNSTRLEDGYGIYTYAAPASFRLDHYWPDGLKFSENTSLTATERASASSISSYTGAVRITKLK